MLTETPPEQSQVQPSLDKKWTELRYDMRQAMFNQGLNIQRVADSSGWDRDTLSRMLRGDRFPPTSKKEGHFADEDVRYTRLAEALRLEPKTFVARVREVQVLRRAVGLMEGRGEDEPAVSAMTQERPRGAPGSPAGRPEDVWPIVQLVSRLSAAERTKIEEFLVDRGAEALFGAPAASGVVGDEAPPSLEEWQAVGMQLHGMLKMAGLLKTADLPIILREVTDAVLLLWQLNNECYHSQRSLWRSLRDALVTLPESDGTTGLLRELNLLLMARGAP